MTDADSNCLFIIEGLVLIHEGRREPTRCRVGLKQGRFIPRAARLGIILFRALGSLPTTDVFIHTSSLQHSCPLPLFVTCSTISAARLTPPES